MLLPIFTTEMQINIIFVMVMPSLLAGVIGVLGALATKLVDRMWLKILHAAIAPIIYLAFCPPEVIIFVLIMYFLGLGAALLTWKF